MSSTSTDTTDTRTVRVTVSTPTGEHSAALTTGEAVYLADLIERNAATLTAGATTDTEREARGHLLYLASVLFSHAMYGAPATDDPGEVTA
jgi:hypothetical protein